MGGREPTSVLVLCAGSGLLPLVCLRPREGSNDRSSIPMKRELKTASELSILKLQLDRKTARIEMGPAGVSMGSNKYGSVTFSSLS